jgi:CheY-like chemotaxis protein
MPQTTSIVLVTSDRKTDEPLIQLVLGYFKSVRVVSDLTTVCRYLIEPKAKILIFVGNTPAIALASYYKCINAIENVSSCRHKMLCAVPRKYEFEVLKAHQDGLIDDFLICRPIYEKARIIQLIQSNIFDLTQTNLVNYAHDNFLQSASHYPEELIKILEKGTQNRKDAIKQNHTLMNRVEKDLSDILNDTSKSHPTKPNIVDLLDCLKLSELEIDGQTSGKIKQNIISLLANCLDEQEARLVSLKSEEEATVKGHNAIDSLGNDKVEQALRKLEHSPRILIVEDDTLSLQLSKKLFANRGVKLDSAPSGQRAINMLKKNEYQLVLMDIDLPDNSGIFVVEQVIKSASKNASTPFVMLTGNKSKSMIDEAIKRGAKGYLLKPLKKKTIDSLFERFGLSKKIPL